MNDMPTGRAMSSGWKLRPMMASKFHSMKLVYFKANSEPSEHASDTASSLRRDFTLLCAAISCAMCQSTTESARSSRKYQPLDL